MPENSDVFMDFDEVAAIYGSRLVFADLQNLAKWVETKDGRHVVDPRYYRDWRRDHA